MINQLLQLVIGGVLGIGGQKIAGSTTGNTTSGSTNSGILNTVIAVITGYLGSNIGNAIPGASSLNFGVEQLGNLFGSGFSLIPSILGSGILSAVVGFVLKAIRK
jgi:uncharacterized membrane protein YeaQ/YmgE (transglycosylase-associated protein family)